MSYELRATSYELRARTGSDSRLEARSSKQGWEAAR
jgi:hypothetical protein